MDDTPFEDGWGVAGHYTELHSVIDGLPDYAMLCLHHHKEAADALPGQSHLSVIRGSINRNGYCSLPKDIIALPS